MIRRKRLVARAAVLSLLVTAIATALATQGMTVSLRPPADMAAFLRIEVAKWAAVIKAANVSVD